MKVHIYFEILSIKEVEKVGSYKWSNLMGESNRAIFRFSSKNGNLSCPIYKLSELTSQFFCSNYTTNKPSLDARLIPTLISGDVGGQLGLFLGANIVTIFEFVDFYLRLLWYNIIAKYLLKSLQRPNNNHQTHIQP